ncbi:hypothetical protein, partial [Escherichia coli]|uniref:hypothetical protein n=1 Tax=Escherichia coli TaxID=562 RepID=UPI001AA11619
DWKISLFEERHKHVLATPKKVHLLRSHRQVSVAKKDLFKQFASANVLTSQNNRILEIKSGGIESIGCTETDLRNHEKDA